VPNHPVDNHVGKRLRKRRAEVGMSQEKLADSLAITFQQIQKYEKGANRISSSRLQTISTILGVPPAYFFEGLPVGRPTKEAGPSPEGVLAFVGRGEGASLAKAFLWINDDDVKRRIVELVEALAGKG
jgi:transcriptional regulator with XRE-family HTH domain